MVLTPVEDCLMPCFALQAWLNDLETDALPAMRTLPSPFIAVLLQAESAMCCSCKPRVERTWQSSDANAVLNLLSLMPCFALQAWLKVVKGGALPTINGFLVAVLLTMARVKRWETAALDLLKVSLSAVSRAPLTLTGKCPGRSLRRQCCCT